MVAPVGGVCARRCSVLIDTLCWRGGRSFRMEADGCPPSLSCSYGRLPSHVVAVATGR